MIRRLTDRMPTWLLGSLLGMIAGIATAQAVLAPLRIERAGWVVVLIGAIIALTTNTLLARGRFATLSLRISVRKDNDGHCTAMVEWDDGRAPVFLRVPDEVAAGGQQAMSPWIAEQLGLPIDNL